MGPNRPPPNDYDAVADIYDAYVQPKFDLEFFREEAARSDGPILELMAGTGRVTQVFVTAERAVTCVDRSAAMLRRLHARFRDSPRRPLAVCADICALPLDARYALIAVPFHSLTEVVDGSQRRAALGDIRRLLAPGGRFVVTMHNPARRTMTLDGRSRRLDEVPLPGGEGSLDIAITGQLDRSTRIATVEQEFVARDATGHVRWRRQQTLRFALVDREEIEAAAGAAGFSTTSCYGDYDRSPFDADASPYLILVFEGRPTA